jgi:hypothetical protein
MEYGFGELTLDDGTVTNPLDLISRPDSIVLDSSHAAPWCMRTENVRIPRTGTIGYTAWDHLSNDSLYRSFGYDTVTYSLEIRDSATDQLLLALDSLKVYDTLTHHDPVTRTIDYRLDSSMIGYIAFVRNNSAIRTDSSRVQDVLTPVTLSDAFKKSTRMPITVSDVLLMVRPNPFRSFVDVDFELPERGAVRIEVRDALGRLIDELSERQYGAGSHSASWTPTADVPTGIYTFVLRYGNDEKIGKAILTK